MRACKIGRVTGLIHLGPEPDDWWQAQNRIFFAVLDRAEDACGDDAEARQAMFTGKIFQNLEIANMDDDLARRVAATVRSGAVAFYSDEAEDERERGWVRDFVDLLDASPYVPGPDGPD